MTVSHDKLDLTGNSKNYGRSRVNVWGFNACVSGKESLVSVLFLSDIAFKADLTIGVQVNMFLFYGAIYK